MENEGEDLGVFVQVAVASAPAIDGMRCDDYDRGEGEHVDPRAAPRKEILFEVSANDCRELPGP